MARTRRRDQGCGRDMRGGVCHLDWRGTWAWVGPDAPAPAPASLLLRGPSAAAGGPCRSRPSESCVVNVSSATTLREDARSGSGGEAPWADVRGAPGTSPESTPTAATCSPDAEGRLVCLSGGEAGRWAAEEGRSEVVPVAPGGGRGETLCGPASGTRVDVGSAAGVPGPADAPSALLEPAFGDFAALEGLQPICAGLG